MPVAGSTCIGRDKHTSGWVTTCCLASCAPAMQLPLCLTCACTVAALLDLHWGCCCRYARPGFVPDLTLASPDLCLHCCCARSLWMWSPPLTGSATTCTRSTSQSGWRLLGAGASAASGGALRVWGEKGVGFGARGRSGALGGTWHALQLQAGAGCA